MSRRVQDVSGERRLSREQDDVAAGPPLCPCVRQTLSVTCCAPGPGAVRDDDVLDGDPAGESASEDATGPCVVVMGPRAPAQCGRGQPGMGRFWTAGGGACF